MIELLYSKLGSLQVENEHISSGSFWEQHLGILVRQSDLLFAVPEDDLQRRPADLSAASVQKWIRDNCQKLDVSPSRIALMAGLAASTLNRFLKGGKSNLNADTITSIAQAFARTAAEMENMEAPIVRHWEKMVHRASVPLVGKLDAGDTTIYSPPFEYAVLPIPSLKGRSIVALEINPEGGLVFARPFYGAPRLADGTKVLGHIRLGDRIESIPGTYRISPGPPEAAWLVHAWDRGRDKFLGGLPPQDYIISSAIVGQLTLNARS